jgi:hypothetical protein
MAKFYKKDQCTYRKIKKKSQLPPTEPLICLLFHGNWREIYYFVEENKKLGIPFTTVMKCHKCKGEYKTSWIN